MSDKKRSSARFSLKIDNFDGVNDGAKHKDPVGSSQIVNFRIDKNGSLKKRCGFKKIVETEDDIDGVWSGKLFGENKIIFVADSSIYEYTPAGVRLIGQIDGLSDSEYSIFFYDNCLYFLNSAGMYRLDELGFSTPICYAPLIGKDWPSGWIGPENEKKNLLSDYVRISYLIEENPVQYLRLTEKVEQVISVYKNGVLQGPDDYTLDNEFMVITPTYINKGDVFELTLKYFSATDGLSLDARSATQCTLLGGIEKKRPYLWGTDKGDSVYVCKQLTTEQKSEAKRFISCVPFYVTEDDIIKVGTGNHKVMALSKHLGRTLIFTENDTWRSTDDGETALDSDGQNIRISDMAPIGINTSIGVRTLGGVTLVGNDPISIGDHSLFRWTSNTDELDEQNAYPISSEIDPLINDKFREKSAVYFDRGRGELYFYSNVAASDVWVWNVSSKKWVCFDGFEPSYMFEYDGETAFVSGNTICVFYDYLTCDVIDSDNRDIEATFTSNPIDFGCFEDKHVSSLRAYTSGGVTFELFYDESKSPDGVIEIKDNERVIAKRISGKRFKQVTIRISASGDAQQSVHSVELTAR